MVTKLVGPKALYRNSAVGPTSFVTQEFIPGIPGDCGRVISSAPAMHLRIVSFRP